MLATYGELLIGVQQASSMAELYFMIRNTTLVFGFKNHQPSTDQPRDVMKDSMRLTELTSQLEDIKKCLRLLRICLYIVSAVFLSCFCIFMTIYLAEESTTQIPAYLISQTSFSVLITLSQIFAMGSLYTIIFKHFKGDLDREYRLLVICQSIFALSFIVRSILIILVANCDWVDFPRDYPDPKGDTALWVMFVFQFLIYNFVPYMTIVGLHWFNLTRSQDFSIEDHSDTSQLNEVENYRSSESGPLVTHYGKREQSLIMQYVTSHSSDKSRTKSDSRSEHLRSVQSDSDQGAD
mmetsp:Transcript_47437/g.62764  ORF Transcript_47437/g.62764 Transcript_47437/m.62764 type:complete len:294 (+) Transcript_47437:1-882(+)